MDSEWTVSSLKSYIVLGGKLFSFNKLKELLIGSRVQTGKVKIEI